MQCMHQPCSMIGPHAASHVLGKAAACSCPVGCYKTAHVVCGALRLVECLTHDVGAHKVQLAKSLQGACMPGVGKVVLTET